MILYVVSENSISPNNLNKAAIVYTIRTFYKNKLSNILVLKGSQLKKKTFKIDH